MACADVETVSTMSGPRLDFLVRTPRPLPFGLPDAVDWTSTFDLGSKDGTPVARRKQVSADPVWQTPMNKGRAVVASPLSGRTGAGSELPVFPALPFWGNEAKTPESKSKGFNFTPPPAPSLWQQQRDMDEDVKMALSWNSVHMVKLCLQRNKRSCPCGVRVDHSVHEAVNHPHLIALEFLLNNGSKESINEACNGQRPLSRAIRMAHTKGDVGYEMARLLLEHGAQPNMAGTSPLHEAAACASPAAVALLCSHGADPNAVNDVGRTPLHVICKRTLFTPDALQEEVVEVLLAHGANPTALDANGLKPSEQAARAASMSPLGGGQSFTLRDRLLRAERWWMRRSALLVRHGQSSVESRNIYQKLPGDIFKVVVRFL